LQRGVAIIPKSSKPERIEENAQVWDFSLSQADMDTINSLETGERLTWKGKDPEDEP